jgi:hypothetical protein
MKRYLVGLLGCSLLGMSGLAAVCSAFDGEAVCATQTACSGHVACCPHCGCKLVPVCQTGCTTKKVTNHRYDVVCKELCIPGVTPVRKRGDCAGGCDTGGCNNGCGSCGEGHCRVREVHQLVKYPVTKEVPVKTCTVTGWTCPNCGGCGGQPSSAAAPAQPTAAPKAVVPVPKPAAPLPPAPRTTEIAPRLPQVTTVQVP